MGAELCQLLELSTGTSSVHSDVHKFGWQRDYRLIRLEPFVTGIGTFVDLLVRDVLQGG